VALTTDDNSIDVVRLADIADDVNMSAAKVGILNSEPCTKLLVDIAPFSGLGIVISPDIMDDTAMSPDINVTLSIAPISDVTDDITPDININVCMSADRLVWALTDELNSMLVDNEPEIAVDDEIDPATSMEISMLPLTIVLVDTEEASRILAIVCY
jgi:hypothetical protein